MSLRSTSLRWRVIVTIAGISLLLLGPAFTYLGLRYRDSYRQAYWGEGDLVTLQIQQIVETVLPYVVTLKDAPGLDLLLRDIAQEVPEFDFLAIVDSTGRVIVHSRPGHTGERMADLTSLKGVGYPSRRNVAGKDLYIISRALPKTGNESHTLYVVVAEDANVVDPWWLGLIPILLIPLFITVLVFLLHRSIDHLVLQPLFRLAEGVAVVAGGDLSHEIVMHRNDEFGVVAQEFNEMARRLRDVVSELERRVEERTIVLQQRTRQLEAVGRVTQESLRVHDVRSLLNVAVQAISEKFEFYHTGIFLLDDTGTWAVLRAASSEGGLRMLAHGHRLRVGTEGIVGYVAQTGVPRIALDVGQDAVWFDNPDLPMTRSEVALPLIVEGKVSGVLDVQSEREYAFKEEELDVLQLMADQVAIALYNVRLLEKMEGALEELREVQEDYSRRGWARVGKQLRSLAYEYDRVEVSPVPPMPVPPDLKEGRVAHKIVMDGGSPVLMQSMKAGDRVLGYLSLIDPERIWTPEEFELMQGVSEQVASALETARLFEESQRTARQQSLISNVLQLAASPDLTPEQIPVEIARELAHGLGMAVALFTFPITGIPLVHPYTILDPDGEAIQLFPHDFTLSPADHVFFQGMTQPELGPMTSLLESVDMVGTSGPIYNLLKQYDFEQVLYVPLRHGGTLNGFIALIQQKDAPPFGPATRDLAMSLSSQISVVMDNLKLSAETRRRAQDLERLYHASIQMITIRDVRELLEMASQTSIEVFNAARAVTYLKQEGSDRYLEGHAAQSEIWLERYPVLQPHAGGLTERIIESGESLLIHDNRQHDRIRSLRAAEAGLLSAMVVPLVIGGENLGVLYVSGTQVAQFTQDDLHLLEFLAAQVSAAVQNALQIEKTERALEVVEVQARYRSGVSQAVSLLAQDGTQALPEILGLLGELTEFDRTFYAESKQDDQGPYWRISAGWVAEGYTSVMDTPILSHLPTDAFPFVVEKLQRGDALQGLVADLPERARELLAGLGFNSILFLPVIEESSIPGFLGFAHHGTPRFLADTEISALRTVTAALSNTLARERLFRQVQASLSAQEQLYEASAELNRAQTYDDVLKAMMNHTVLGDNPINVAILYFSRPWIGDEVPEWSIVLTRWSRLPNERVRPRYRLSQYPSVTRLLHKDVPTLIEDVESNPIMDEAARTLYSKYFQATSTIFIPLVASGRWVGYINGIYPERTKFPEDEVRKLMNLSGLAAVTVQNIHQLRTIETRARRERMIREINARIQAAPDVPGVLQTVVRELGKVFGTERNVIRFQAPEESEARQERKSDSE